MVSNTIFWSSCCSHVVNWSATICDVHKVSTLSVSVPCWCLRHRLIIKSPRSRWLCFQFISAAVATTATVASHVKTVSAKPYKFGTNIFGLGKCTADISMTLTQGHGSGFDKKHSACLHDTVAIFVYNFGCIFKVNIPLAISQEWFFRLTWNENWIGWILGELFDLDLWPLPWHWPWIFQGHISK